jgi:glycosyltransferase involved in cell wall biosynthesis
MAQYLGDAVDSVLRQTIPDLEVLVIDDGSTDATAELMARYADNPRVHYHRQANAGQTKAKNAGIARAQGTFVAFCDADDLWVADKLQRQLPLFERPEVGVVYSRRQRILASGEAVEESDDGIYPSGRITERLFLENFIPFGTTVVRRSYFEEFGAFDERYRMGIDWDLWLRMSTRCEFGFVDAATYLYRVWPGQMSNNWRGRYEAAFRIMEKFIADHPGVLSPGIVREAYAHSYTERGRLRSMMDREYSAGIRDVFTALRYRASYFPAWKLLIRIGITAAGWPVPRHSRPCT